MQVLQQNRVVETGKSSTVLFQKYITSSPPLRVVEWPRKIVMHVFTFGGLSQGSADYMQVGRFCSSRRGGEWLVRVVRRVANQSFNLAVLSHRASDTLGRPLQVFLLTCCHIVQILSNVSPKPKIHLAACCFIHCWALSKCCFSEEIMSSRSCSHSIRPATAQASADSEQGGT